MYKRRTVNSGDRFTHHTSGTLTLLQCVPAPSGVVTHGREVNGEARVVYAHTPGQLPNEILRPGGTRWSFVSQLVSLDSESAFTRVGGQ